VIGARKCASFADVPAAIRPSLTVASHASGLLDDDLPIFVIELGDPQDVMAFVLHAAGNVRSRFIVIDNDAEHLARLHNFQRQFRFDKCVWAHFALQIQFFIGNSLG
jgi:hypothetical protein